jgi:hypothetical protein
MNEQRNLHEALHNLAMVSNQYHLMQVQTDGENALMRVTSLAFLSYCGNSYCHCSKESYRKKFQKDNEYEEG